MNERKTENLVRSHFNKYFKEINIEEQKSENPKIDKLLKMASKKGIGKGYPEFIITFKDNADLIIVVECKADTKKHKSESRDKYSEYAVDGVLLYTSYLSKEYDILAIAVSGETKKELKISHFLQLKRTNKPKEIFGDKLLPPRDYLKGYLGSDEKIRQDYTALLDFSRDLNQGLHILKIAESKRSLLISCILIALENKPFKVAYKKYDAPKKLAKYLVDITIDELEKVNIRGDKLEDLKIQYSFIKAETSLTNKKDVLKNLIEAIDNNINKFVKNHKYYDVLGQFYIEFLRYANSDKGLGIVLTPPHITELFTELAQVNKNSVIYDNCSGTGGFLISAMRKMIEDARGNKRKERQIKTKQIVGVEYQSHIFPLAVSNMYIHQDGKTNIIKGSCFDEEVKKEVVKFKPNIGFLNPPYKADKRKDIDELEFILNNLEILQPGGVCIAIVPMQNALAQKGKVYELKERLLKGHTLEAVLSVPNELFFNSNIGVVTCVMIFTAHKPHPQNKETYFGYYKDDGFVKRKNKGRIDAFGKWEKIKEKWVYYYLNRKEEAGFSVNKKVTAKDEWCAEAYMETDYTKLKKEDFEKTLKDFVVYSLKIGVIKNVFEKPVSKKHFTLDISKWKKFKLLEIFDTIEKGERLIKSERIKGDTPLVTATSENNGVVDYISYDEFHSVKKIFKDKLTIDMFFNVFFHKYEYFSDDNVHTLISKKGKLNKYVCLFLASVLKQLQYKYDYGRQTRLMRLYFEEIKLPIDKNGKPDFEFMENYIKGLPYSSSI